MLINTWRHNYIIRYFLYFLGKYWVTEGKSSFITAAECQVSMWGLIVIQNQWFHLTTLRFPIVFAGKNNVHVCVIQFKPQKIRLSQRGHDTKWIVYLLAGTVAQDCDMTRYMITLSLYVVTLTNITAPLNMPCPNISCADKTLKMSFCIQSPYFMYVRMNLN